MPELKVYDPQLASLRGLHLWHAPMSSCSQRVRLVIEECGTDFESHLVDISKDEHASEAYQNIHPKGLVPALVDDGRLFIESIDIIRHIAQSAALDSGDDELLQGADDAQLDLKLLTFEFLFRAFAPPPTAAADAFESAHRNDWLRQFRRDFAAGFSRERLDAAVSRTDAGFRKLDDVLADGRPWLAGKGFSLSDIAWMPNVHRFCLMDWPFDRTPHLRRWFVRAAERESYQRALLDWQPGGGASGFADYTVQRRADATDVTRFGSLRDAD